MPSFAVNNKTQNYFMKNKLYLIFAFSFILMSFKQDKPAYMLFNEDGKKVSYADMLEKMKAADIVFLGEQHTDPIVHWLQYELTKDLYNERTDDVVLGAEMFEADNQLILTEYLNSVYSEKKFLAEMRLWNNYHTDYKPLVEFAKENEIPFVATNIPRRYANVAYLKGFEGLEELSDEAKKYIAPLPINYDPEVACYKNMLAYITDMGKDDKKEKMPMKKHKHAMHDTTKADALTAKKSVHSMHAMSKSMQSHGMENLPKSQAAKDATMAHFIMQNWANGKLLIHYNGTYHSDNFEGIVWHLLNKKDDLKIITLSSCYQESVIELEEENLNKGNFILCVPESMTQTNRK